MAGGTRVSVGYVRRAHGIKGGVIIRPLSDNPDRFSVGERFLTDDDPYRELTVAWVRSHNDGLLVGFEGVSDRNAAEALQGATLTIDAVDRRPLGADEYWPEDLEGLTALTPDGVHLGTVSGVVLTEAQDRLVVTTPDGRAVEVPFVEAIVGEVHPSHGHVVMTPPEGLF